jgi:hypothetical protein
MRLLEAAAAEAEAAEKDQHHDDDDYEEQNAERRLLSSQVERLGTSTQRTQTTRRHLQRIAGLRLPATWALRGATLALVRRFVFGFR